MVGRNRRWRAGVCIVALLSGSMALAHPVAAQTVEVDVAGFHDGGGILVSNTERWDDLGFEALRRDAANPDRPARGITRTSIVALVSQSPEKMLIRLHSWVLNSAAVMPWALA